MATPIRRIAALGGALLLACASVAAAVSENFTVPEDALGGARPDCANGKLATGGGYESDATTSWTMRGLGPSGRGFRTTLRNDANSQQAGRASTLCAGKNPLRRVRKTTIVELDASTRAADRVVRARCPRGTKLAGGGFSLGSPLTADSYVQESRPAKRSWRVRATLRGDGVHRLTSSAVCDERAGSEYRVIRKSALEARRRARGGLSTIFPFAFDAQCAPRSRPTAGGFQVTGGFDPRWRTIAPQGRGYSFAGRDGYLDTPSGDIAGYAICRK